MIKQKNIVDVVKKYIELKELNSNYKGVCPFHDDAGDGSLIVSPAKNIFHCFGCGNGGSPEDFEKLISETKS